MWRLALVGLGLLFSLAGSAADLPATLRSVKPSIVGVGTFLALREQQDQLGATAYPGNSGSPLYEIETGRVVGVINSVFVKETKEMALSAPSGISYAIPVDHVRRLLDLAGLKY